MKTIPLLRGGDVVAVALVDDEDFERLSGYRWYPDYYLGLYADEEEAATVAHEFRVEHMPDYEAVTE